MTKKIIKFKQINHDGQITLGPNMGKLEKKSTTFM